ERVAFASGTIGEVVRTQRGFDEVEIAADDGVIVDARHCVERILQCRLEMLRGYLGFALFGRIETRDEQRVERARDVWVPVERGGDEILALRDAGLLEV